MKGSTIAERAPAARMASPYVWPAFVCGALSGAILGVLLAPMSGRETRHWIAWNEREARERAARFIERNRRILKRQRARAGAFLGQARTDLAHIEGLWSPRWRVPDPPSNARTFASGR